MDDGPSSYFKQLNTLNYRYIDRPSFLWFTNVTHKTLEVRENEKKRKKYNGEEKGQLCKNN